MDTPQPDARVLQGQIAATLREAGVPLRAIDVSRRLAEAGVAANKESVNKALYGGPFERIGGPGAPTWKVHDAPPLADGDSLPRKEGHFAFQVDGVGAFYLRDGVPEDQVDAFLTLVTTLIQAGTPRVVRPDATAGGQMVVRLAEKQRLAVERP